MPEPIHPDVNLDAVDQLWEEWQQESEVEESVDEILDRNYFETISSYDPRAGLERWLRLRLRGPQLPVGQLDTGAVQKLLHAFHAELQGAAHRHGHSSAPQVRLAGLTGGSAVLHLVPAAPEDTPTEDQVDIVADQFDALMTTVTDLHDVAENEGDLRRFADHESLLKGLREMVKALDAHDLELDLTWRNARGGRRTSQLTRHACEYVRGQWEDHEQTEVTQLTGRLTAIDLKGTFTLKRTVGPRRTYEIEAGDEDDLMGLRLELGSTYTVKVQSVVRRNRAGIESSPSYRLITLVASDKGII